MPFYEYECPSCRFYTEVMQKISDKPLKKCPSCGKGGFKRLISAPVFRLKGSGWYETDFKSDKENKRNLVGERDEAKPADAAAKPDAKDKAGDSKAADGKGVTEKADSGAGKAESASAAPKAAPASSRRRNTAPARAPARKRAAPRKAK